MSLPNIEIHIRKGIWQIYKKQRWPTFFDANIKGKVSSGSGLAAVGSAYKKRASLPWWGILALRFMRLARHLKPFSVVPH